MLSGILAAIGGIKGLLGLGTSIAQSIADAKIAAITAGTEEERIRAEERAKALEAKARTHGKVEAFARLAFALPYIAWLWKAVAYDKVWMGGTTATDGLTGAVEWGLMIVMGFYFLAWWRR